MLRGKLVVVVATGAAQSKERDHEPGTTRTERNEKGIDFAAERREVPRVVFHGHAHRPNCYLALAKLLPVQIAAQSVPGILADRKVDTHWTT
eukprot:559756-Rhodomonas_salina.1